nr:uncharacterized protein LOC113403749 [Vanessa tameamea]
MYARVLKFVALLTHILTSTCVRMTTYNGPDIKSKFKLELKPLHIPTGLGDIIILSGPIINSETLYFLSKPNSDTMKLKLNISRDMFDYKKSSINDDYNDIIIQYIQGKIKAIITPINKYKIFNLNYGKNCQDSTDIFREKEKSLLANDFMLGPLGEEDNGNWILSAYYKGNDGNWIEVFQVITVEITESIPTFPTKPKLDEGNDLELRFAYPVRNLQSCQITAPRSTFDRFYDRDRNNLDSCGFTIPNVTKDDEGLWRIIGVGNIVYEANVFLEINKKS